MAGTAGSSWVLLPPLLGACRHLSACLAAAAAAVWPSSYPPDRLRLHGLQVVLRTINSSLSAYLSVTFNAHFFDAYDVLDCTVVQAGLLMKVGGCIGAWMQGRCMVGSSEGWRQLARAPGPGEHGACVRAPQRLIAAGLSPRTLGPLAPAPAAPAPLPSGPLPHPPCSTCSQCSAPSASARCSST